MAITFRQAASLIKKYNSGQLMKSGELESLLEWLEEFKEQLQMEQKVFLMSGKSKNKNAAK